MKGRRRYKMVNRIKLFNTVIISTAINGVAEVPCRIAPANR